MLHFHKTNELICIGLEGGGVSTYNFMFYVIGRRLNNSVLARFMRTHAFFFFVVNAVVLARVFRGRCVDRGSPDR
jgi:hypothetical protein